MPTRKVAGPPGQKKRIMRGNPRQEGYVAGKAMGKAMDSVLKKTSPRKGMGYLADRVVPRKNSDKKKPK